LLKIHACDYSKKAIEIIRTQEAYQNQTTLQADVWDAAGTGENALPPGLEAGSVDVVVMIFIFSALSPRQWAQAVKNVWNVLKPGGVVLFRDYGRGDLAQVRFKKGRYLEENFYIRGDGTRVYFFERDELADIWSGKLPANSFQIDASEHAGGEDELAEKLKNAEISEDNKMPAFEILNLGVDNRMLVNRQRKLKMYRCWMQGRFQKPTTAAK
ncbi:methyltransferase, partial [Aureobasidium melanogenum]